ncbi:MAG: GGDEF domain-containing protein [Phycisphaeraceae bacterium]
MAGSATDETTATPVTPARRADSWASPSPLRGDVSLRVKIALLTLAALVMGVLIGLVGAQWGQRGWPVVLAGVVVIAVVWSVAQAWVLAPLEQLLRQIERTVRRNEIGTARGLRDLPRDREDEIGRIARSVHCLAATSLQYQHEARTLRRNMAHQIAESTQRATSQLRRLAHRDPLTELGNRRCLDDMLPRLIERAHQTRSDVFCIAIDIDNFKQINDTLGHARGDETLVSLGQLLDGYVRPGDLAVRLGGDEFLVFLPGGGLDRAQLFVEQVQRVFRQRMRALLGCECWADLSMGVASLHRDDCANGPALVEKADEYLYQAKHSGKGRCHGLGEPTCDSDAQLVRHTPA